ncbi:GNAT family N-acetyltransferase [Bacillus sp. SLBN-3]
MTERMEIRPLRAEDYDNWFEQFDSRYPALSRHDQGKLDMSVCTKEWFCRLVESHQGLARTDDTYIFGVFRLEDGTHLGMIDLSTLARGSFQWARIGYTIHNQHWRNGYGKEAVKAVLELAFNELNYHRVEAHINLDNPPSIKLAESVGMKYECRRKGFIYEHDEWTDHLVYYCNAR